MRILSESYSLLVAKQNVMRFFLVLGIRLPSRVVGDATGHAMVL